MSHARPRAESAAALAEQISARPAAREVVPVDPQLSARWHMHGVPSPYSRWNFHPEYEVHLIRYGTGRYIVGDLIDSFSAGQLVLVGSNVPHHWISDLEPGERIDNRDVVFQFHPAWLKQCQVLLPELSELEPMLTRSARGIEFSGRTAVEGARELLLIGESQGAERVRRIFGLLGLLAAAPADEYRTLAKPWLPLLEDQYAADVVDRVFTYILSNLVDEVRLSVAAEMVNMSESSFSRYFKRASGQTFSETVRKLRLAHACKLLRQTNLPVSSIFRRVGYANLSNFNRRFRSQYGVTPTTFRERCRVERRSAPAVDVLVDAART
jgi:AraC-like DNA-binding protein